MYKFRSIVSVLYSRGLQTVVKLRDASVLHGAVFFHPTPSRRVWVQDTAI